MMPTWLPNFFKPEIIVAILLGLLNLGLHIKSAIDKKKERESAQKLARAESRYFGPIENSLSEIRDILPYISAVELHNTVENALSDLKKLVLDPIMSKHLIDIDIKIGSLDSKLGGQFSLKEGEWVNGVLDRVGNVANELNSAADMRALNRGCRVLRGVLDEAIQNLEVAIDEQRDTMSL